MTIEERLKLIIGSQVLVIASLETQLEQAQAKIADFEKVNESDKGSKKLKAV